MSRFMMLVDRATDGWPVVAPTMKLAERLEADGVAVVVAQPRDWNALPVCEIGTPGFGVGASWMPSMLFTAEPHRADDVESLFQTCCREATCRGLQCETQWTRLTVLRAAATVSQLFGLIVVCRESLLDESGEAIGLRDLFSVVEHPLLVASGKAESWRRIVIAGEPTQEFHELMQWGRHWSERLDLPLLPLQIPSSRFSTHLTWKGVWQRLSPNAHRNAVRLALQTLGLGPSDLLLTSRRTITWPSNQGPLRVSPNDFVETPLGAVGFLPTVHSSAACQFLRSAFDLWDAMELPPHESFAVGQS